MVKIKSILNGETSGREPISLSLFAQPTSTIGAARISWPSKMPTYQTSSAAWWIREPTKITSYSLQQQQQQQQPEMQMVFYCSFLDQFD